MRCWIELDGAALRKNLEIFQSLAGTAQVMPVVKSNAYGHGLTEIYQALRKLPLEWLAVNYISEAEDLRKLGYTGRIMVVGPIRASRLSEAKSLDLDIFLVEDEILDAWLALAPQKRPNAHIKFDTGMSRQGFLPHAAPQVLEKLRGQHQQLIGICSHFANVEDVLDQSYGQQQMQHFVEAQKLFESAGIHLMPHMAASSSALLMQASRFSLLRIGISIYGLWPSRTTQLSYLQQFGSTPELSPVLTWKTEVAIVKQVKAGQFIGYGCSYKALRDMTVAVLPVGYFEGYPRLASNRGYVLIKGQRCPIVGRICMNMMMVDVSHLSTLPVETVVTLIGSDGEEHIDAAQIGEWAETIHYEIVTQLNPAIPRILR